MDGRCQARGGAEEGVWAERASPGAPSQNVTAHWGCVFHPLSVILALGRIEGDAGFLELTTPASGSA